MNFKLIYPTKELADYIRFFWFLEFDEINDRQFTHHAFAHHCPEIVFCYKGQFKYNSGSEASRSLRSGIYGQTERFSKVTSHAPFGVFGVYLYPYALAQLFNVSAHVLTNQSADLETLCGVEGRILEEKVMLASDNLQRVNLVSDFLKARLTNVRTEFESMCSSIKQASNSFRQFSVRDLAGQNFLSVRQFERRFKQFAGFNPKLFLRITKFNAMLGKTFENKTLSDIAFDYGYYDHAHFTHDFHQFSNSNPKEYFNKKTQPATDRGTVEF
jgi:AraC-like DNA-binding protein